MPLTKNASGLYALRRTIPWWNADDCLDELLEFCRTAGIDEVIVKVDTEEFSHGHPTLSWLENYLPVLHKTHQALDDIGVRYSLNPWGTLLHCDRGRDLRETMRDFDFMVGHDGVAAHAVVCPLSVAWRDYVRKLWGMYASTHPAVVWVEDDIRTFNHRPVDYGCFCDLHLAAFSERVGEPVTRDALVRAVGAPGKPHPWRKLWLELQGNIIIDTCDHLRRAVQDVSPDTAMGLMSSGPGRHSAEGRQWDRLASALAGNNALYSRPPLGSYCEMDLQYLYYSAASIKRTRFMLPDDTIEQSEVENVPFTAYSKSLAFTFLQMAISFGHGCDAVTMNLFDHLGTPLAVDPGMATMLERRKPFLTALRDAHRPRGPLAGVRVLCHAADGLTRQLSDGDDYGALCCEDTQFDAMLNRLGFATTVDDSPVTAADGQLIAAYSDDEIRTMLSGGLLLDLRAAEVLIDRGFGEHLGVDRIEQTGPMHEDITISAEELTDPAFAGAPRKYLSASLPHLGGNQRFGRLVHRDGVCVISRLVDADTAPVCDFIFVYENTMGGRVAVIPMDMAGMDEGRGFCHPYRQEQLTAVLNWISRDQLPARVTGGVYPLSWRMDRDDRIMLGVLNLSHDDWDQVCWDITIPQGRTVDSVVMLDADGAWIPAPSEIETLGANRVRITVHTPLSFRMPLVIAAVDA